MRLRYTLPLILPALLTPIFAAAIDLRDVKFNTKNAGSVTFSHKAHIRQKGINSNCKACHNDIFDMKKRARRTMAEMEKGMSCGACHNGKKAFPLKDCAKCHRAKEVTFQVKAAGPTLFSHKRHLTFSQCGACHPSLYATGPNKRVTMAEMEKGKSCGACHNGKKAFSIDRCGKCHPTKEIIYKVKETGPTLFSHNTHTGMYKCGECHTKIYQTKRANKPVSMAEMEKGKSCGACHDAKTAFNVSDCIKCHPTKELNFKVQAAGDAKFSHTFHTGMYKCQECHTKIYQTKRANKPVSMAEMEAGKSCGACHDSKSAFTVKENCGKCHNM